MPVIGVCTRVTQPVEWARTTLQDAGTAGRYLLGDEPVRRGDRPLRQCPLAKSQKRQCCNEVGRCPGASRTPFRGTRHSLADTCSQPDLRSCTPTFRGPHGWPLTIAPLATLRCRQPLVPWRVAWGADGRGRRLTTKACETRKQPFAGSQFSVQSCIVAMPAEVSSPQRP